MTLVLIAASLILFLWIVSVVAGSASRALRSADQTEVLSFDESEVLDLVGEKRAALTALKETELDHETGKVGESEYEELHAAAAAEAIGVMKRIDDLRSHFRYQKRIDQDLEGLGELVAALPVARQTAAPSEGLLVSDDTWEEEPALSEAARIRARHRRRQTAGSDATPREATPEEAVAEMAAAEAKPPAGGPQPVSVEAEAAGVAPEPVVATSQAAERRPEPRAAAPHTELAAKGGFCVACGHALVAGARFCGECGHKVGTPVGDAS